MIFLSHGRIRLNADEKELLDKFGSDTRASRVDVLNKWIEIQTDQIKYRYGKEWYEDYQRELRRYEHETHL